MTKNIALIDDDEGPILYYQMALEDAGFHVIRLRTFQETLAFINCPEPLPDFWVVDVMMSIRDDSLVIDGIEATKSTNFGLGAGLLLYRKIKEMNQNAPAILLTSISTPELLNNIEEALDNEEDTCEAKLDVLPEDLVHMIKQRL